MKYLVEQVAYTKISVKYGEPLDGTDVEGSIPPLYYSNWAVVLNWSIAQFDTPNHLLVNNQWIFYWLAKDAKLIW